MDGIVKWFSSANQPWGFIGYQNEQGSPSEVFVHFRQILPDNQENPKFKILKAGQRVSFEIGPGYPSKGTQALKVRVLDDNTSNGIERTP